MTTGRDRKVRRDRCCVFACPPCQPLSGGVEVDSLVVQLEDVLAGVGIAIGIAVASIVRGIRVEDVTLFLVAIGEGKVEPNFRSHIFLEPVG